MERCSTSFIHWRNVNQNHNEVALFAHKDRYNQQDKNQNCWRGCGKTGVHFWWEFKMVGNYEKGFGISSKTGTQT